MKKELRYTLVTFLFFMFLLLVYPNLRALVLFAALFVFGFLGHKFPSPQERIAILLALIILATINILLYGVVLGIDFRGGIRIPITLDQVVDDATMQEIIIKLKSRLSAFGMEQVVVKRVGTKLIYVEVPAEAEDIVNRIKELIEKQGKFQAVVDGKVVLAGEDILPATVIPVRDVTRLQGADWGVEFSITGEAAERFAQLVRGKGGMPIYMYLDKPVGSVIVLSKAKLLELADNDVGIFGEIYSLLDDEAGKVDLIFEEEFNGSVERNRTYILANETLASIIEKKGGRVVLLNESDLYPELAGGGGKILIQSWKAIGLISAPILSPTIGSGKISLTYIITGRSENPEEQERMIISLLKGGGFPVKLRAESMTTVPPTFGERFFHYSLIGIFLALIFVSVFIALRYKSPAVILPMILITLAEVLIIVSLMGSLTLDLAAMAGIIAAAGVSIDAQIIITDNYLKEKIAGLKEAFLIIRNNLFVVLIVLLPLLVMGSTEIVGFAVSTVLAYLLGYLISRPAYAALLEISVGR